MLYLPRKSDKLRPPLGARLNTRHPLARGLMVAYLFTERGGSLIKNHARPGWFDLGFGNANAQWLLTGPSGRTIDISSTGYLTSSMIDDPEWLGPLTISVRGMQRTGGTYLYLVGKTPSNTASFSPFDFGSDNANPQKLTLTRALAGINQFRSWGMAGAITLNKIQEWTFATPSNLIEQAPYAWIDGVPQGVTNVAGLNSGPAAASGVSLRVGRRFDGVAQMDGILFHVYIWKRFLGHGEVQQLVNDPYQMWMIGGEQFTQAAASAVNPSGGVGITGSGSQICFVG